MQVESTKKSPGTFSGTRFLGFAMIGPPFALFYPRGKVWNHGEDPGRFDEDRWRGPTRIHEGLPGAVRYHDVPWWFGDGEDVPPFLGASMEPTVGRSAWRSRFSRRR
jgi:hypothetical protein